MRITFWVAFLIFVLDQASKYYVLHVLQLDQVKAIDVIPPFFNLRMAWNEGVNFGLFSGLGGYTKWILITIALVISAWVVWWVRREKRTKIVYISAGFLLGGALGNVIDRLLYNKGVVDFINMSCCGINNPFAFNVADITIFAGAIGLVFFMDQKKTP